MKIVGFDLDDTLVAEALFIRSGIHHIAHWLHCRLPKIPEIRIINRMEAAVILHQNHYSAIEVLLEENGLTEAIAMREIVKKFRNHRPDSSIYHLPHSVEEILLKLKSDPEVKLVLITDGRSITQRNKIEAAQLSTYFEEDDIYISEETGHDKISPDTFLHIMEKHAGASEFHYVGDNPPKDFLHPSKLGWKTHLVHPFPLMVHQGIPR